MLIVCEKCKKVFEVNERHLTAGGVTAVCPHCEHKHRVKRIIIPYSTAGEDDTEPHDLIEMMEGDAKKVTYVREDDLSDDLEPIEVKSEVVVISQQKEPETSQVEGKVEELGKAKGIIKVTIWVRGERE